MEHSSRSAELVSDVFSQLDLERFHAPGIAVKEESSNLADRLPVCCNDGSSSKVFGQRAASEPPFLIYRYPKSDVLAIHQCCAFAHLK